MTSFRGTLGVGRAGFRGTVGRGVASARGSLGVGRIKAIEASGPVGPVYAPTFAGISHSQLRFKDLIGTVALGDPIDSAPLVGSLITGSMTATGTARPILSTHVNGLVGAQFDGVDDVLSISGISVDMSAGVTAFMVVIYSSGGVSFNGSLRFDAGSLLSAGSCYTWYENSTAEYSIANWNSPPNGYFYRPSLSVVKGTLYRKGAVMANDAAVRGIYIDGTRVISTITGTDITPDIVATRYRTSGYGDAKLKGWLFDQIIYNGVLTAPQIAEVFAYLTTEWTP